MLEPSEYQHLRERNFEPYSKTHQEIYFMISHLLAGSKSNILEIGAGIGWGLEQLIKEDCFLHYTGIEPSEDSYAYILDKHKYNDRVLLLNDPFEKTKLRGIFDVILCVEVLEHLWTYDRLEFLKKVNEIDHKTLILTTPNRVLDSHGVLNKVEATQMLKDAGYSNVINICTQYARMILICQK